MSGRFTPTWMPSDDAIVRQMTADKRTAAAIAEVVGRSATAVRIRRRTLGISPGSHNNGKKPKDRGTRIECLIQTIEQAKREHRAAVYIRELRTGLVILLARERGL
jgi:hypothetical protein